MAALTEIHKREIVERLACFESPSEVAAAMTAGHGIEIVRQQAHNYDASRPIIRARMARALVELFDRSRAEFLARTEGIAIANRAYRLKRLDEMERAARGMRNYGLAAEMLEQAAKETGDVFTNRRDVTSKGEAVKALIGVSIEDV